MWGNGKKRWCHAAGTLALDYILKSGHSSCLSFSRQKFDVKHFFFFFLHHSLQLHGNGIVFFSGLTHFTFTKSFGIFSCLVQNHHAAPGPDECLTISALGTFPATEFGLQLTITPCTASPFPRNEGYDIVQNWISPLKDISHPQSPVLYMPVTPNYSQ